jgi:hypothetical protein
VDAEGTEVPAEEVKASIVQAVVRFPDFNPVYLSRITE